MKKLRILFRIVLSDIKERVRRYSFFLTMLVAVYLGYAVYDGQINLWLGTYRGVDNSAWLGSLIGLVGSQFVSLIGFYIVKNAVQRDRVTRVGKILATTSITKFFYVLSKTLSNFAVLVTMILILAADAFVIQLSSDGFQHINPLPLFSPLLIFGLSAVSVTAALAVLFETVPVLRGGVGNVIYFLLWTGMTSLSMDTTNSGNSIAPTNYLKDYAGFASITGQMQERLRQIHPHGHFGASLILGGGHKNAAFFVWTGISVNSSIIVSRGLWLGVALCLTLFAALLFDRFDPARQRDGGEKKTRGTAEPAASIQPVSCLPRQEASASGLTPILRRPSRLRFSSLAVAEFLLLFRGRGWWWYAGSAALILSCLASPLGVARSGLILASWFWPLLLWSQLGTRESEFSTQALIFPSQHSFPRLLLATWVAGVVVALVTGSGLGLRLLLAKDLEGLASWSVAAVFIPSLALALGVCTKSRKPFEALYPIWWYIGPLQHFRKLDFIGTTSESSTPILYLVAAGLLLMTALSWRQVELWHA